MPQLDYSDQLIVLYLFGLAIFIVVMIALILIAVNEQRKVNAEAARIARFHTYQPKKHVYRGGLGT